MSKMNVLMMGVLAAATVVADDGKGYRICGLDDGGRLMLVESRKREVRPVVALPVEEAPLATAVFNPGEKLDDFDCEALEHHLGAVRIDAGEDGVASVLERAQVRGLSRTGTQVPSAGGEVRLERLGRCGELVQPLAEGR